MSCVRQRRTKAAVPSIAARVSNLFSPFFSPFRYRTLVLLFHQWVSEFQCGFCAGPARAASDLSDGVSAAEIPW